VILDRMTAHLTGDVPAVIGMPIQGLHLLAILLVGDNPTTRLPQITSGLLLIVHNVHLLVDMGHLLVVVATWQRPAWKGQVEKENKKRGPFRVPHSCCD